MVVSEMGARLSPKIDPLITAPHIRPILISNSPARGHITAETAVTVPVEVPQAVEMITQTRNATTGINPVLICSSATIQIIASMRPQLFSSADSRPAIKNATQITQNMDSRRPASISSP